jgi:small redox-active disulfide protein 2
VSVVYDQTRFKVNYSKKQSQYFAINETLLIFVRYFTNYGSVKRDPTGKDGLRLKPKIINAIKISNMEIKILGSGCAKCKKLEQATRDAVNELNIGATVEKVEDMMEILQYGVAMTPAMVVDGQVLLKGRIASVEEIKKLLTNK